MKTNLGEGQYEIELVKGEASLLADEIGINDDITRIGDEIFALEQQCSRLQTVLAVAYGSLQNAIISYTAIVVPTPALRAAVKNAQTAYITAQANLNKQLAHIRLLELEKSSLEMRRAKVEEALGPEYETVWCADYSTELLPKQQVGTLEVNGETKQIIIMPAGGSGNGLIYETKAMSPSGWFYNAALFPCWQKVKPTYRIGEIITLNWDGNTCSVALDDDRSRVKGLPINQVGTEYLLGMDTVSGWDTFAATHPNHPLVTNTLSSVLPMTNQLMIDMQFIQDDVQNRFDFVLDQDLYNKLDHWSSMSETGSGDVEDFALTKADRLINMGYPASAIHIEVGYAEDGFWNAGDEPERVGHAWLVVQTDAGDYALDNKFKNVVLNDSTTYTDRKRQTGTEWNVMGTLLENVPVVYMTRNADVFEVGDMVVVEFTGQTWDNPKVIGFESFPRPETYGFGFYEAMDSTIRKFDISKAFGNIVGGSSYDMGAYGDLYAVGYSRPLRAFLICYKELVSGKYQLRVSAINQDGAVIDTQVVLADCGYDLDVRSLGCFTGTLYFMVGLTSIWDYNGSRLGQTQTFVTNQFGAEYAVASAVTRLSDGTILWAGYDWVMAEQRHYGRMTYVDQNDVVTKTVLWPCYPEDFFTSHGMTFPFVREVNRKLLYACMTGDYDGHTTPYPTETGNCELRICDDIYNPEAYSVRATSPRISSEHSGIYSIIPGVWSDATAAGEDYVAYYRGYIDVYHRLGPAFNIMPQLEAYSEISLRDTFPLLPAATAYLGLTGRLCSLR